MGSLLSRLVCATPQPGLKRYRYKGQVTGGLVYKSAAGMGVPKCSVQRLLSSAGFTG